jgi:hypothetical protein
MPPTMPKKWRDGPSCRTVQGLGGDRSFLRDNRDVARPLTHGKTDHLGRTAVTGGREPNSQSAHGGPLRLAWFFNGR